MTHSSLNLLPPCFVQMKSSPLPAVADAVPAPADGVLSSAAASEATRAVSAPAPLAADGSPDRAQPQASQSAGVPRHHLVAAGCQAPLLKESCHSLILAPTYVFLLNGDV